MHNTQNTQEEITKPCSTLGECLAYYPHGERQAYIALFFVFEYGDKIKRVERAKNTAGSCHYCTSTCVIHAKNAEQTKKQKCVASSNILQHATTNINTVEL